MSPKMYDIWELKLNGWYALKKWVENYWVSYQFLFTSLLVHFLVFPTSVYIAGHFLWLLPPCFLMGFLLESQNAFTWQTKTFQKRLQDSPIDLVDVSNFFRFPLQLSAAWNRRARLHKRITNICFNLQKLGGFDRPGNISWIRPIFHFTVAS